MKTKVVLIVAIILTLITNINMVYAQEEYNKVEAKIVENKGIQETEQENGTTKKEQNVEVRILEGEYEHEEYEMTYVISEDIDSITSNAELQEDDRILVRIEEAEGEITSVVYLETITINYTLYIVGAILLIILLIISRKRATIIYLLTIILTGCIIIFSLQNGWNLILVSSILSLIITIILFTAANGIKKETLITITKAIIGIAISGVLTYLLFDIMKLASINIKITDKLVNIKDLICSATILFSCGIYNAIAISAQYIFYATNKPYKTKSDNIIEGQRSLKL